MKFFCFVISLLLSVVNLSAREFKTPLYSDIKDAWTNATAKINGTAMPLPNFDCSRVNDTSSCNFGSKSLGTSISGRDVEHGIGINSFQIVVLDLDGLKASILLVQIFATIIDQKYAKDHSVSQELINGFLDKKSDNYISREEFFVYAMGAERFPIIIVINPKT